jgi:hypothetical protein
MRKLHVLPLAAALVWMTACNAGAGTASAGAAQATSASSNGDQDVVNNSATASTTAPATGIAPPRPDAVLYLISNVDGNGALSYEVANGAEINFWYGLQFESGGKQYYTGFAWETPRRFGDGEHFPAPGTKVTLSNASFVASGNPQEPWKWEGSEPFIGEFGGNERANEVDPSRRHQLWHAPNGDVLLAVPSTYFVSGARMRTFEVLHFNAQLPLGVDDRRWRYLATLEAGGENSAECEDNPGSACYDLTGTLEFVEQPGGAMPLLSVTFPAGSDARPARYRYDPQSRTYRPT